MPPVIIPQLEADRLIAIEKIRVDDEMYQYPGFGGKVIIPLTTVDRRENFLLDIERNRINLLKGKYQNRVNQAIILLRLDFGGPPHRNPDDEEIPCPHLHIYREGEGDQWAYPVSSDAFPNVDDPWECLSDFLAFCNVTQRPVIMAGLFT